MPIYTPAIPSYLPAVRQVPDLYGAGSGLTQYTLPRTYIGPASYASGIGSGPIAAGSGPIPQGAATFGETAAGEMLALGPGRTGADAVIGRAALPDLTSRLDFLANEVPQSGKGFLNFVENTGRLGGFPNNPLSGPWQALGKGGLMANSPGRVGSLVSRATSGIPGTLLKGAGRMLLAEAGARGIEAANRNLLGDTGLDPTNAGQLFGRGAAGGLRAGGPLGWVGAVTGTLGAGLGNVGGNYLSNLIHRDDGESGAHLGNVPLIGSWFGGGSGSVARNIESKYGTDLGELTAEKIGKRLDQFGLTDEQRKAVTGSFNAEQASLRGQGMSNAEATAQLFQKYFTGAEGRDSLIKQFKEGKVNLTGPETDTTASDLQAKALAYQQLLQSLAPDLMKPQTPDLGFINELMGRSIGRLAQSDPTMAGYAEQMLAGLTAHAQDQANAYNNLIMNLPMQYAKEDVAKAQAARDKMLYDVQVRQMAGSGNKDIVEP